MIPNSRRQVLRRYRRCSVEFSESDAGPRHKGIVKDDSIRGMHFSSPVAMERGVRVWIISEACRRLYDQCRRQVPVKAVVCWCRQHNESDTSPFSIGVVYCNGRSPSH